MLHFPEVYQPQTLYVCHIYIYMLTLGWFWGECLGYDETEFAEVTRVTGEDLANALARACYVARRCGIHGGVEKVMR